MFLNSSNVLTPLWGCSNQLHALWYLPFPWSHLYRPNPEVGGGGGAEPPPPSAQIEWLSLPFLKLLHPPPPPPPPPQEHHPSKLVLLGHLFLWRLNIAGKFCYSSSLVPASSMHRCGACCSIYHPGLAPSGCYIWPALLTACQFNRKMFL